MLGGTCRVRPFASYLRALDMTQFSALHCEPEKSSVLRRVLSLPECEMASSCSEVLEENSLISPDYVA